MSLACAALLGPPGARAQFSLDVSVNVAPPDLPVYTQPPMPADGWLWTPGYWAYSEDFGDYYWVPGTWVLAPQPGYLWTPGYWGYEQGAYVWYPGYWGPQVGFYGGVNYGFGYGGVGYQGGYWRDNHLYYNTAVNNVGGAHITNVYQQTVINNVTVNRVSYNGGAGGIQARPTAQQMAAAQAPHLAATTAQRQQVQVAQRDPSLRQSANNGHPAIAATARPGEFNGPGVVPSREATTSAESRGAPEAAAPRSAAPRVAPPAPPPEPRAAPPAPRAEPPPRPVPPPAPSRPNPPHAATRAPEHTDHEH
jgi:hypothetical protein